MLTKDIQQRCLSGFITALPLLTMLSCAEFPSFVDCKIRNRFQYFCSYYDHRLRGITVEFCLNLYLIISYKGQDYGEEPRSRTLVNETGGN